MNILPTPGLDKHTKQIYPMSVLLYKMPVPMSELFTLTQNPPHQVKGRRMEMSHRRLFWT